MKAQSRFMAIDYGAKHIGVALSDPFGMFASPHRVITHRRGQDEFAILKAITAENNVAQIVVGLPTGTDGGIGMQGRIVIKWARGLAQVVDVPIVMWDESYSSDDARQARTASSRRKSRDRRRPLDDAAAAAILQDYLNARESNSEPGQPLEDFGANP